jgi:PAS domain S-box-containing protein
MEDRALSDDQVSHAQFKALANSIPNLAWMAHPDGWFFWYNRRWYEYTGSTPEEMAGWGWQSVHHPDVLPRMLERWTDALARGEHFEMTFPLRGADGVFRPFLTRVEPLKENGRIVGWYGTNTEVTEQERARERLQLLVNELNHRVKNTLATIQSLASHTFRRMDPAALETFNRRLISLANVHDILTRESWDGATVRDVVETAIGFCERGSFEIAGPELWVDARAVSSLAMTLHELCTNAVKHGALSVPAGRVSISWRIEDAGDGRRILHLVWQERGGPPVVAYNRRGFGLRLIERLLTADKGATVAHAFEPEGVRCTLRFPVSTDVLK